MEEIRGWFIDYVYAEGLQITVATDGKKVRARFGDAELNNIEDYPIAALFGITKKVEELLSVFRENQFQGIELTEGRPRIITLCGSSRFCAEMAVLAWEFEKGGCIALGLHLLPQGYCEAKGMVPDADGNVHHIGEQEGVEDAMDALHFKKIEMCDSVFIVNVDGYIGSSTAREIAYAEHLGKPITYLTD